MRFIKKKKIVFKFFKIKTLKIFYIKNYYKNIIYNIIKNKVNLNNF